MELTPVALGTSPVEEAGLLRISTYNVWFDEFHREERHRALLETLRPWRPHVMAFQEVTARFLDAVSGADWLADGYWASSLDPRQLGVLILCRLPVERLWLQTIPTRLGRRLLVADLRFGGARTRVATAHFESLSGGRGARHEQLQAAFETLAEAPAVILLGDFNFGDGGEEEKSLDAAYVDAWRHVHPDDPGYTRDTLENPMGRAGRAAKRERLDRILCRGWVPGRVARLGTEPFLPDVFPSDHFGLLAELMSGG